MAFKYRLERVLELRQQELDKVKTRFQETNEAVRKLERKLHKNATEQRKAHEDMMINVGSVNPKLYLNRLKQLESMEEKLREDLERAKSHLERVRAQMLEAQQKMKILEKHKEKKKKEFAYAEQKQEENELNELGLTVKRLNDEKHS